MSLEEIKSEKPVFDTQERMSICGCGRPVRYMINQENGIITGACYKFRRCMSYEELENSFKNANRLLMAYRDKRAVDGLNGRKWDASKHFEAEAKIEALEAK